MTSLLSGRQVHLLLTLDDQDWAHPGAHKRANWQLVNADMLPFPL